MTKANFDEMLKMVPGLSIRLNKIIGLRRRKIENKILDLLYSSVEERIEKTSSMKEFKRGEILYLQGTSDKNIYILKKGAVKINKLSPEGRVITLDILKGGTLFGELGAIENADRDETAEVIEDCLICIMTKANFDEMLKMVPGLSIRLNKIIGLRRRKIENKHMLDDFGIPDGSAYILKVKLTHQDLSELIASTRETTTATLNSLKKDGLIDYEGKYIRIIDKEKLESIYTRTDSY
jgi:CRP-like cAMP-binding protein